MTLELLIYICIAVPGLIIFGHFEAGTRWRKLLKHGLILGTTYALYATVGRPWPWLWLLFMGAGHDRALLVDAKTWHPSVYG